MPLHGQRRSPGVRCWDKKALLNSLKLENPPKNLPGSLPASSGSVLIHRMGDRLTKMAEPALESRTWPLKRDPARVQQLTMLLMLSPRHPVMVWTVILVTPQAPMERQPMERRRLLGSMPRPQSQRRQHRRMLQLLPRLDQSLQGVGLGSPAFLGLLSLRKAPGPQRHPVMVWTVILVTPQVPMERQPMERRRLLGAMPRPQSQQRQHQRMLQLLPHLDQVLQRVGLRSPALLSVRKAPGPHRHPVMVWTVILVTPQVPMERQPMERRRLLGAMPRPQSQRRQHRRMLQLLPRLDQSLQGVGLRSPALLSLLSLRKAPCPQRHPVMVETVILVTPQVLMERRRLLGAMRSLQSQRRHHGRMLQLLPRLDQGLQRVGLRSPALLSLLSVRKAPGPHRHRVMVGTVILVMPQVLMERQPMERRRLLGSMRSLQSQQRQHRRMLQLLPRLDQGLQRVGLRSPALLSLLSLRKAPCPLNQLTKQTTPRSAKPMPHSRMQSTAHPSMWPPKEKLLKVGLLPQPAGGPCPILSRMGKMLWSAALMKWIRSCGAPVD